MTHTLHDLISALGVLGPTTFKLGWSDSVSAVIVGCLIGSLGPGLLVTLGAKTGLRSMTIGRYSFGFYVGGFLAFVRLYPIFLTRV